MFDQITRESTPWAQNVQRGDAVQFRCPAGPAGDGDSPMIRPCRVLEADEWLGERHLALASGTSVPKSRNRGHEIPVTHPADIRAFPSFAPPNARSRMSEASRPQPIRPAVSPTAKAGQPNVLSAPPARPPFPGKTT